MRSKGAQQDAASEAQVAQGQAGQEPADGQDKKSDNKAERSESMDLESVAGSVTYASEQEREAARLERKKANAHRVLYKKTIKQITGKNGPRAVSR